MYSEKGNRVFARGGGAQCAPCVFGAQKAWLDRVKLLPSITTTETTFSPVKSTVESQHARTSNELKKQGSAASKVQLEAQHAQGQHSGYQHRALLQSAWACRGKVCSHMQAHFLFFFFLLYLQTFNRLLLDTSYPFLSGFQENDWAQILYSSYFFFAFHRFSLQRKKKKKHLAIISLMMFVFGCVQKLALKIAVFFLRLNFWVLAHDNNQVEKKNATSKMALGLGPKNSATGTEKIFRALANLQKVFANIIHFLIFRL